MNAYTEHLGGGVIVRAVECDCDRAPGCGTVILLATVEGRWSRLWLCTAVVMRAYDVDDAVAVLTSDVENDDHETAASIIETGLALVGLPWEILDAAPQLYGLASAQYGRWDRLPDWMGNTPRAQLWALRGHVFTISSGVAGELNRMPRALQAIHDAYVDEGPALVRG